MELEERHQIKENVKIEMETTCIDGNVLIAQNSADKDDEPHS